VRAAQVVELGSPPLAAEIDGDGPVEVVAVALNPLDLAVAAGLFYGGHPPLPYIPGCEAVARRDGTRVYVYGDGRGTTKDGFLVERTDYAGSVAITVPDELDDTLGAACGIAGAAGWIPVATRAPVRADDRVLVLGATGTVGSVALQAARVLGAKRVVGAGRDRERLERLRHLGANEIVTLDGDGLVERLREACGGDGPTLVVDPLWGSVVPAAVEAAAPGARIVHLGQSSGPQATLPSSLVRGKQLSILGFSVFALSPDERADAYLALAAHVASGRITIEVETFPLDRVADAWAAQARGTKAVVTL
jgi:NADPH:quinone reductase